MYRMDIVLSLILLVSEMLEIPRAKVENHFLKKLAFSTNNCLEQDTLKNDQRQQKALQNTQQYANSYVQKFSYFFAYLRKLS